MNLFKSKKVKFRGKLERFLKKNDISFEVREESILIPKRKDSGFDIEIEWNDSEIKVYFEDWHDHFNFKNVEYSFRLILLGLGENCRLIVKSKGTKDFYFQMQYKIDNKWAWHSETVYPIQSEAEIVETYYSNA